MKNKIKFSFFLWFLVVACLTCLIIANKYWYVDFLLFDIARFTLSVLIPIGALIQLLMIPKRKEKPKEETKLVISSARNTMIDYFLETTKQTYSVRNTMVGYLGITENTASEYLKNKKEEIKTKNEVYSYCDYCGDKVPSGNKYHHECLMKKYNGVMIQ